MVKAVIFDLDGTLLDTLPDIRICLNGCLKEFSLPVLDLDTTKRFVGNGAKKLVERAVGERADLVEKVYKLYSERFAVCDTSHTGLFPFEAETLKKLFEGGIKLNIVTNKPQRATDNVYGKYLANFGFSIVLGQTEYYPLKPDPASTLAIMDKLNVKKEECVFVGDGETDVKTARAAGIKCISVLWGYRTKQELTLSGADCFAKNFNELGDMLLQQK